MLRDLILLCLKDIRISVRSFSSPLPRDVLGSFVAQLRRDCMSGEDRRVYLDVGCRDSSRLRSIRMPNAYGLGSKTRDKDKGESE